MKVELQETSDLLATKRDVADKDFSKVDENGILKIGNSIKDPPDGGWRAISVMIGSFLINGLLFSVINSYSVIYKELEQQLSDQNATYLEIRATLVGTVSMGATFFLSPLSEISTSLLGIGVTVVLGGSIAAIGLLLSSFVVNYVDALCVTHGIIYGLGASLAYTPSLAILGHYFKKYLGIVNGVVAIGSPVFTVAMLPFMSYMIKNYGLPSMFRVLALLTFCIAFCGVLFKAQIPVKVLTKSNKNKNNVKTLLKNIISIEIWKNRQYRFWALSLPIALFGYFVLYIHIEQFISVNFKAINANLPLQLISVGSAVGRIGFGFLGDMPIIDNIMLQQISFYVIGSLTIALPFVTSFKLLVVIALCIGIFDGGFITLIGPIAFELCGSEHAAQGIAFMLGLAAIPLIVGPAFASHVYTVYKSYTFPFMLAGLAPIIGATIMFSIRFQRRDSVCSTAVNGHAIQEHVADKSADRLNNVEEAIL